LLIHARKSTERHGVVNEQKSIACQVEHAREDADQKSCTIDETRRGVFVDDEISGAEFANRHRSDWQKLFRPADAQASIRSEAVLERKQRLLLFFTKMRLRGSWARHLPVSATTLPSASIKRPGSPLLAHMFWLVHRRNPAPSFADGPDVTVTLSPGLSTSPVGNWSNT
jgi:hypothetical protein